MTPEPDLLFAKDVGLRKTYLPAALVMTASMMLTGCLQPLHKQAVALQGAATPVVDEAAAAYRNANKLHNERVDYDAPVQFDQPVDSAHPVYNPRNTPVLLSEKDIDVRLA